MKTSKKDMVRLLCILLGVALIPLLLVIAAVYATEKYAAKPGVFYNDSFYSWDKKAGEFSLQALSDTLTQDGTIDTLLEMTEACYDNCQTNREEFYNARIYRLKNGNESIIYLQVSPSSDTLLLFRQDP